MRKFVDVTPIIEKLKRDASVVITQHPVTRGIQRGYEFAAQMLEEAPDFNDNPAIHARYAKWIPKGGSYRCSHCWKKALWSKEGGIGGYSHEFTPIPSNFCPNCGADMEIGER